MLPREDHRSPTPQPPPMVMLLLLHGRSIAPDEFHEIEAHAPEAFYQFTKYVVTHPEFINHVYAALQALKAEGSPASKNVELIEQAPPRNLNPDDTLTVDTSSSIFNEEDILYNQQAVTGLVNQLNHRGTTQTSDDTLVSSVLEAHLPAFIALYQHRKNQLATRPPPPTWAIVGICTCAAIISMGAIVSTGLTFGLPLWAALLLGAWGAGVVERAVYQFRAHIGLSLLMRGPEEDALDFICRRALAQGRYLTRKQAIHEADYDELVAKLKWAKWSSLWTALGSVIFAGLEGAGALGALIAKGGVCAVLGYGLIPLFLTALFFGAWGFYYFRYKQLTDDCKQPFYPKVWAKFKALFVYKKAGRVLAWHELTAWQRCKLILTALTVVFILVSLFGSLAFTGALVGKLAALLGLSATVSAKNIIILFVSLILMLPAARAYARLSLEKTLDCVLEAGHLLPKLPKAIARFLFELVGLGIGQFIAGLFFFKLRWVKDGCKHFFAALGKLIKFILPFLALGIHCSAESVGAAEIKELPFVPDTDLVGYSAAGGRGANELLLDAPFVILDGHDHCGHALQDPVRPLPLEPHEHDTGQGLLTKLKATGQWLRAKLSSASPPSTANPSTEVPVCEHECSHSRRDVPTVMVHAPCPEQQGMHHDLASKIPDLSKRLVSDLFRAPMRAAPPPPPPSTQTHRHTPNHPSAEHSRI